MSVQFPLINGKAHSFASIAIRASLDFGDESFSAVQSINYKTSKTHGVVKGNSQNILGRTKGQRENTGDIEVLRVEFDSFIRSLMVGKGANAGFGDVMFYIMIQYQEAGMPTYTDELQHVLIDDCDFSNSQGTDPSKTKMTLNVGRCIINGREI